MLLRQRLPLSGFGVSPGEGVTAHTRSRQGKAFPIETLKIETHEESPHYNSKPDGSFGFS